MTTMLMPTYLRKFSCIADRCEDTCCTGFKVPIDKRTFQTYENQKEPETQKKLMEYVKRNPKSVSDIDYGAIDARCSCPFLTETGMCGVQQLLGEQALSSTCSKYPKHISIIDKKAEKWATLSCPEIARLALLDKEGMRFEEVDEPVDEFRDMANFQLQTNALPVTAHFYDLREFTIAVLQDRTMTLDVRMGILDSFYNELNELVLNGKETEIRHLMDAYREEKRFTLADDEFDLQTFVDTLEQIREKGTFVPRYEQTVAEMYRGFEQEVNPIGLEFLEANSHILENYLVHYVFQKLFPFSYGEDLYDSFKMLELHYDLIRIHALGVGSYLGEMDERIAIRVIQSFVKEGDHNSIYFPLMYKALTKRN